MIFLCVHSVILNIICKVLLYFIAVLSSLLPYSLLYSYLSSQMPMNNRLATIV
jgi:hypothetical protein